MKFSLFFHYFRVLSPTFLSNLFCLKAEVKNAWNFTFTCPTSLHSVVHRHRGNFIHYLYFDESVLLLHGNSLSIVTGALNLTALLLLTTKHEF